MIGSESRHYSQEGGGDAGSFVFLVVSRDSFG